MAPHSLTNMKIKGYYQKEYRFKCAYRLTSDFTNLFSAHNFEKNDKVILNYFLKQNIKRSDAILH